MKKIVLSILALASFSIAQAQYWQLPNVNAGSNPGGINNDTEQPAQTGWTSLLATSATPTWSAATAIPFTFSFNGSPVTQFKASSTGVVTFDVATALAAPTATNSALPNAAIPDKSVCIWGLQGTGANDAIVTKTFGTAPNRQFWIQYNSYSIASNAAAWCYWSIVLEETSNNIHIVDHRSGSNAGAVVVALTAGVQINSSSALSVASSPSLNTTTTTTMADNSSDNSYYTFIPGTQSANDMKALSTNATTYGAIGTNVPILLNVKNLGSAAAASYTIKYQEGANPAVSQTISTSLASLASANHTFSIQYNVATLGAHNLKVWVEKTGDNIHNNDTVYTTINGISFSPKRMVVMEEPTGTWCGWCVRGLVFMDSIHTAHPNDVAPISVHNGDPMVNSAYDTYMGTLVGGYPSLVVDRKVVGDPSDAFSEYTNHIGDFGYADITETHSYVGSALTLNATVKPAANLSGDYRLAMVVTEDDVTGTASTYNQANYYSSTSQNIPLWGNGINYQTKPNPIPAAQMNYDFVAREIVGGVEGAAGSLPATMTANTNYNYTFNYTIPTGSKPAAMRMVIMLIDKNGSQAVIRNATMTTVYPTGFANVVKNDIMDINVYPNPATERMFMDMILNEDINNASYTINDIFGNTISKVTLGNISKSTNKYKVDISALSTGNYTITVNSDKGSYSTKFSKL